MNIESKIKYENENTEKQEEKKISTKEVENTLKKIKQIHQKEKLQQKWEDIDAETYAKLHDLKFNIPKNKEINKWEMEFSIGDIKWILNIENQTLKLWEHIYKIKLPHDAKLVSIKITDNKIIIKWKVGFFSWTWDTSLDKLKLFICKLKTEPWSKSLGELALNLKK